jgi:peptidoglycan/xylan/chitin deacetylase (PgdA/CDA1 family)
MVIGDRFAWAHVAKTAGDATHTMLVAVPGLVRFADPPDSNDKHLPFFARDAEVAGKLLVMNIRRLPAWTLSGAHHKAAHGVHPDYRPLPLETADEMTSRTDADDLLRWMTDHGRFAVDRWLRAEALEQDVLALLAELGVASTEIRQRVLAVGRVNVGSYERDPLRRFSEQQIRRLYALNPTWAGIERRVYGSLLGESAGVAGERPHLDR